MDNTATLQDRKVVVTIFAPSDVKHREPMQIRGRIAYIGDLADDDNTLEIEVDATSVELPVPKLSDGGSRHDS